MHMEFPGGLEIPDDQEITLCAARSGPFMPNPPGPFFVWAEPMGQGWWISQEDFDWLERKIRAMASTTTTEG